MGRISTRRMRRILARHPRFSCPVYIETGLHTGRQLLMSAPLFQEVHGIELDAHWAGVCEELTREMPHVTIHHADTRDRLPELLDRYDGTPCFIHLDAHYCRTDPPIAKSEFPLWDELDLIRKRDTFDIVSVDDVHTFGKSRDDLRYSDDAVEWEGVTSASILEYFGDRAYDSAVVADAFLVWKAPDGTPPAGRRRWWWPFGS